MELLFPLPKDKLLLVAGTQIPLVSNSKVLTVPDNLVTAFYGK